MGWIQRAHENLYFPAFEGLAKGRQTARRYREALQSQWLPREELERRQLSAVNALLGHAKARSPFWRERLAGVDSLASLDELARLPVLTKGEIREHFDIMLASDRPGELWKKSTGGSTGEPLHFAYTRESFEWRVAMSLRGYRWAGAPPGSRQAYIWGTPIDPPGTLARTKESLHRWLERKRYYDCFTFDELAMRKCVEELQRWQPDAIVGYTNPLYELARLIEKDPRLSLRVPSVLCAAEKVHAVQREAIAAAFDAEVFDTYGSREFMLIAAECEAHEGLHVSMENLIVEVVDEGGLPVEEGGTGRLVITDLHNLGMPFIRYEIGDLARFTRRQCSCGRGLQLLEDIVGRTLDVIRTPAGRVVPGEFFPHLMKEFPDIQRFQVVQERLERVRLLLMGTPSAETELAIRDKVSATLGEDMELSIEAVTEIPLTATGKHRVTISRLQEPAA